jgi:hypothetical protein
MCEQEEFEAPDDRKDAAARMQCALLTAEVGNHLQTCLVMRRVARTISVVTLRIGWHRAKAQGQHCEGYGCSGGGAHDELPCQHHLLTRQATLEFSPQRAAELKKGARRVAGLEAGSQGHRGPDHHLRHRDRRPSPSG